MLYAVGMTVSSSAACDHRDPELRLGSPFRSVEAAALQVPALGGPAGRRSDELTGTVVTLRRPNPLDYPPHQPRMRRNKPAPLPSRFFRRGGERGERKSSETNDITTAQSENTGRLRSWCFVNLFGMWQGRSRCMQCRLKLLSLSLFGLL